MFVTTLSPSKIKVFDECKAKYKFKYIDYLKEDYNDNLNTDALQFGQFIHKVLEDGVNCSSYDDLKEIAKSVRGQYTFSKEKEILTERSLKNFISLNKNLTDTVSTEFRFEIDSPCKTHTYNGIIDRVVKGKSGEYLVIDYKTSKRAASKRDLYTDVQMQMYAFAIHVLYNVSFNNITVAHYYPHLDKLVSIKYPAKQMAMFLMSQKNKYWDIKKRKKCDFFPVVNRFCDWCGYKDLCPAHGADLAKAEKAIKEAGDKRRAEKKRNGFFSKDKGRKP